MISTRVKTHLLIATLSLVSAMTTSCRHVDNDRIPPAPVRIIFNTVADWDAYGTPGAAQSRIFIKSMRIPSNFPYTALTETGFGGILLCGDLFGAPVAYDLSCPVEMKADIRITVDDEALNAYCPVCHSVYDIFNNYGHPLAGKAAELGYGLQRYYVGAGPSGEYMVVRR